LKIPRAQNGARRQREIANRVAATKKREELMDRAPIHWSARMFKKISRWLDSTL
jgi:hypothetical protein